MDERVKRWWIGFAAALFLLVPVDLLTTLAVVDEHGIAVEVNPIMRWLLAQGALLLVLAHLAVVVAAVWSFHVAVGAIQRTSVSSRPSFAYGVDIWLTLILAAGAVIVANNLLVLL